MTAQDPPDTDGAEDQDPEQGNPDPAAAEIPEVSSVEWLQQFADGDEAAFERLLEEELPKLRRRVEDRLGVDLRRRIDPSDVLQQAALDVYQLRSGFEDRGLPAFRAWLKTVTFNNLNRLIEKELLRRETLGAKSAGRCRREPVNPSILWETWRLRFHLPLQDSIGKKR